MANLASVSASAVPASQNEQWARLNNDPLLMVRHGNTMLLDLLHKAHMQAELLAKHMARDRVGSHRSGLLFAKDWRTAFLLMHSCTFGVPALVPACRSSASSRRR